MKSSSVGVVALVILVVVTGIGFGIAQAGGNHSERPALSFANMDTIHQGDTSNSYVETRPPWLFEDTIETGSLPKSEEIGSNVIFGDDVDRELKEGIVTGGP